MNFKSTIQLLDYFNTEDVAVEYYENIRWAGKPVCPHCGVDKTPYRADRKALRKGELVVTKGYKCSDKDCGKKFTVKTGTIFANSNVKLRTWFAAIYLATTSKKGISSVQLASQLAITQKTAWFILHRIREMLKEKSPTMLGEENMVEVDETYIGGKERFKHGRKKRNPENLDLTNEGLPYVPKKVVIGIIERNGKVVLKHVPSATRNNMVPFIEKHVPRGSRINTDEATVYQRLNKTYTHKSVKHAVGLYVDGDVHTNTIENFWSVLKRGLYGIYHQVSEQHLERYLDEFSARFNNRELDNQEKFEAFLKRNETELSYNTLIGRA